MRRIAETVVIGLALALLVATLAAGQDAEKGKAVFTKYCGTCHGPVGKGDGPMGVRLNPKLKDFSDKAFNGSLKDDYIAKLVKEGGKALGKSPMMPKMGGLTDPEVTDIIAYIRSLAK